MIRRWLERRRAARTRIEVDANDLRMFMGLGGRHEALFRAHAFERSATPDRREARHWYRVSQRIAELEGYVIGLNIADRYEIEARSKRGRR